MTATLPPRIRSTAAGHVADVTGEHLELVTRPWTFRLPTSPMIVMAVRPAGVRDLLSLAHLHRNCSARSLLDRYHRGGRPPTAAALESELRERLVFVVSTVPGAVAGGADVGGVVASAAIGPDATHGPKAAEVSLLVADAWQRRGIGSTLLSHLAGVAHVAGNTELIAYPATAIGVAQRLMLDIGRTRMVPDSRTHLHTYLRDDATLGLGTVRQRLAG